MIGESPTRPWYLSCTARGTSSREVPSLVYGEHTDGVVVVDVDLWLHLAVLLFPLLPRRCCIRMEQLFALEPVCESKIECTLSYDHDVRRLLHNLPRDGDGMHDVLEERDGAAPPTLVHDARIEGHDTEAIRSPAVTDGRD